MIEKNTVVFLAFVMRNSRGEILEEKSVSYLHGASAISPALQAQLQGLSAGDQRRLYLEKGRENADDDFTFDVTIRSVRKATPRELRRGVPLTAITIHLVGGFLGSGKTTAIREACRFLSKQGVPVAVITNDQGDRLVDGDLFTHLGIPSDQVNNGCFCCQYNELDAAIHRLLAQHTPAVVFAESVGSCTDLVATVFKPLLRLHPEWRITASVFADARLLCGPSPGFDEAIDYIYARQLEEARLVVVSKSDLIDTTQLEAELPSRYPGRRFLYQDSFNKEHIARWLQTLDATPFTEDLPSLDIDYQTYGDGEAKLAWLDQQLEFTSCSKEAQHAALSLIRRLARLPHPIGHLKFLLDGHTKISVTAGDPQPSAADHPGWASHVPAPLGADIHPEPQHADRANVHPEPRHAASATLLINARVQTEPAILSQFVADAVRATERATGCSIRTVSANCFQPAFPRPIHRIP